MKNRNHILTTTAAGIACFALLPIAPAAPETALPSFNTADGDHALFSLTTGAANTAVGWFSLKSVTTGSFNTGVGAGTLVLNSADSNTATGAAALLLNTTGTDNTANGTATLVNNSTGSFNSAFGAFALNNNIADGNTAVGFQALLHNTSGDFNTANGFNALSSNTEGGSNTATGNGALSANNMGGNNTATGVQALQANTTGSLNTAIGVQALFSNTEGNGNTAIGQSALSVATGTDNIGVGNGAGVLVTTADNVICIGTPGADQSNSCYIGNIFGQEVALDGVQVLVDSLGKLGVQISSRRFKEDIKAMDKASEALLALKPVTFHYKSDAKNTPCFGLIAEDVAEVNPDLVVRDKNGEILTVRYDQVNAMLLNEFLKEHKRVEEQESTIAQLKKDFQVTSAQQQKEIQFLTTQLKKQAAQIQSVSAQVEVSKPASQVVMNRP